VNSHISENLPRLLTGDATRGEVLAAAAHLRDCPDCQQELVSAVVAHASLTCAHRFAPAVVTRSAPLGEGDIAPSGPLPDLGAMFARLRDEASTTTRSSARQWTRGRWLAAAAAVVVVAGGGVTIAETAGSGPSTPAAQTITLRPVGDQRATARVTFTADRMRIDASALPRLDSSRQYEVWLADGTGAQLRPIGYVGSDRTAELPVPNQVRSQYQYVAISIQRTNQVQFSGDMVARGYYG
jgi:hypothetical protein